MLYHYRSTSSHSRNMHFTRYLKSYYTCSKEGVNIRHLLHNLMSSHAKRKRRHCDLKQVSAGKVLRHVNRISCRERGGACYHRYLTNRFYTPRGASCERKTGNTAILSQTTTAVAYLVTIQQREVKPIESQIVGQTTNIRINTTLSRDAPSFL